MRANPALLLIVFGFLQLYPAFGQRDVPMERLARAYLEGGIEGGELARSVAAWLEDQGVKALPILVEVMEREYGLGGDNAFDVLARHTDEKNAAEVIAQMRAMSKSPYVRLYALRLAAKQNIDGNDLREDALEMLSPRYDGQTGLQIDALSQMARLGKRDDARIVSRHLSKPAEPFVVAAAARAMARLDPEGIERWTAADWERLIGHLKRTDIEIEGGSKVAIAGVICEIADAVGFRAWKDAMPEIEEAERMRLAREREFVLQAAREGGGRVVGLDEVLARDPTLRQIREKLNELEVRVGKRSSP